VPLIASVGSSPDSCETSSAGLRDSCVAARDAAFTPSAARKIRT
jgi:hypothetical protein